VLWRSLPLEAWEDGPFGIRLGSARPPRCTAIITGMRRTLVIGIRTAVGIITGTTIGMVTLVIRPIIGRISMSGILDSMSSVVLGMATIAASHGVVRGKAADVTSKIRGGPVVTKHASPLRSGRARITMDIGCTPITLCGIAQILPLRHWQWMLTL